MKFNDNLVENIILQPKLTGSAVIYGSKKET